MSETCVMCGGPTEHCQICGRKNDGAVCLLDTSEVEVGSILVSNEDGIPYWINLEKEEK